MVDIHDRQPVTFNSELAREWLDPVTPNERAEQMVLVQGEPAEAFECFNVGNVRNQSIA
jgi:putative SOS response-associated peptidase YedK